MADVRRNKALATVLQEANVTDASGRPVDLSALTPGQLAEPEDATEPSDG
jgi:trigger factor